MRSRAWAVAVALATFGTTSWARAQCSKDIDCKGARVCEQGRCVDPAPQPPPTLAPSAPPANEPPASAPPANAPPAAAPAPAARGVEPEAPTNLWSATPPARVRRSTAAFAGGIVMVSAGPLLAIIGIAMNDGASQYCAKRYSDDFNAIGDLRSFQDCVDSRKAWGIGLGVAGGLVTAAGIPLLIWGNQRVPADPRATLGAWASPSAGGLRLRLDL